MRVHRLGTVESTNKYCEALDLAQVGDGECFWALEQTAGVGQRGNRWHSEPGLDLTFSVVLHPTFLPAGRQFALTQALALAVADCIEGLGAGLRAVIKWPNDIYVGGRKVCGTLVSARLVGGVVATAVCGVGLNVGAEGFPEWVPRAASLRQLTGRSYELEPLLDALLGCIGRRYGALRRGEGQQEEYLGRLMNMGVAARYSYLGEEVVAVVRGVDGYGRLLLSTDDGRSLCCAMKEVGLIWPDA